MDILRLSVALGDFVDTYYIVGEGRCTRYEIVATNLPNADWVIVVNGKNYKVDFYLVGPTMEDKLMAQGMAGGDASCVATLLGKVLSLVNKGIKEIDVEGGELV